MSSMSMSQTSLIVTLLTAALAYPGEYWALATPASESMVRSLHGQKAAQALGRTLWCGAGERYNGVAGPMWYVNPFTAGCSNAAVAATYVHDGHVHTAAKGGLIKMTCDNWQRPVPKVVDFYRDRCACAADEWCVVIKHAKWGAWAMAKDSHTPKFDLCGKRHDEDNLWKPLRGRCVKYCAESQSCIPTLFSHVGCSDAP